MFNQTKNTPNKRGTVARENAVTILTSGCHFNGKLYCRGSSRIGGKIEGEIISEGLLIIEDEARIEADIQADEAVIQGHVEGKLEAKGRVELCSTSTFVGDIVTPVLVIREGAQFNGRANMNVQAKSPEPVAEIGRKKKSKEPELKDEVKPSASPEVAVLKVPEVTLNT